MAEIIDIREYIKEHKLEIASFIETENPGLLRILEEEKIKAGLDSAEIHLMLPEDLQDDTNPDIIARVHKIKNNDYEITLYPAAMKSGRRSARSEIRHEIAHIKYGDLDRRLPGYLKRVYNLLVEEPRAKWYAKGY